MRGVDAVFMLPLGVSAVTVGFGFLITLNRPPLDLRSSWVLIPIAQAMVALPLVVRTLLPTLREALALHDLKALEWWRGTVNQTAPLIAFPHQQGALGPASHLALADAATADHTQLRAAATDATLGLLATGALDGVAAGPAWALAAPLPSYKLGRWASHLRDVAASSVAGSRYVWDLLRQVLPVLFEATRVRPGAADLVGIAAEAALVVGAKESVPGLDAVADRSGSARLTIEARRLRTVLSG